MKPILLLLATLYIGVSLSAQSENVSFKGVYRQGKVLLRWAPADFATWQKGNAQGYRLERFRLSNGGVEQGPEQVNASRQVLDSLLKPASEAFFVAMSDTCNEAGVAAAALYENTFEVETNTGGSQVSRAINANTQQENRFGFGLLAADGKFAVARGMALGYVDESLAQPGETYLYRLYLNSTNAPQTPVLLGALLISTASEYSPPTPPAPQTEVRADQVLLSWLRAGLEQHYTTYKVEFSSDGGQNWTPRNANPLLSPEGEGPSAARIFYGDQLTGSSQGQYRIRGVTPFGFSGAASAGVSVSAKAQRREAQPYVFKIEEVNTGSLTLTWEFPDSLNAEIQRMEVRRSSKVDGPFSTLASGSLPATARSFTDAAPLSSNYYQVVAIHQNNYEMTAFPALGQLKDETPPAIPTGLSGSASLGGAVQLKWTANPEADVRGYRVFSSNVQSGDFVEVSKGVIPRNNFEEIISLNTLSEKIYYRVSAVDFHENESEMGPVLTVQKPDIVPPAEPILVEILPNNQGISLRWLPSVSEDAARHVIERKASNGSAWQAVWESSAKLQGEQSWLDTNLTNISTWDYRLVAYDDAKLFSSTKPSSIKATTVKRAVPSNTKAEIGVADDRLLVKLLWQYPQAPRPMDIQIFRAKGQFPLTLHATLPMENTQAVSTLPGDLGLFTYKDKDVKPGSSYRYQIVVRFTDGISSPASPEFSISLQ